MEGTLRQYMDARRTALKNEWTGSWLPHIQDVNRYTMPRVGRFIATDRNRGDRRNQKILHEAATFAVNTAVRGLSFGITNPARPWIALKTPYPEINRRTSVKIYLEALRDRMLEVLLRSNVYTTFPAIYRNLLLYGTDATAANKDRKSIVRFENLPVGSYYLATSGTERPDTVVREYQRTRRQLIGRFGVEKCTSEIQQAAETGAGLETGEDVVHMVEPNPNHNPESPLAKDRAFRSIYWQPRATDGLWLSVSGSNTFPIFCSRWDVQDGDAYGASPLMDVLGSTKGLQKLESSSLTLLDLMKSPPMNVPTALKNKPVSALPNGINYVSDTENARISPIFQVHDTALGHLREWRQEYVERINQALFVDIFLLLAGNDREMTAREVQARIEEKVQTLGPIMLRLNDELLDPLVERVFEIMGDDEFEGLLPEAPEELQGLPLIVEYMSDVHKAMKSAGAPVIERVIGFAGQVATQQKALGLQPTAWDKVSTDDALDLYFEQIGAPAKVGRDAEAVEALRAARQADMEKQKQMVQMQAAADTAHALGTTPADPESLLGKMGGRRAAT